MPEKTERKNRTVTLDEWHQEGNSRFGKDMLKWRFVCPSCGHVASAEDYKAAGAPQSAVGFSCVGRWLPDSSDAFHGKPGPCNYAGGGLFRINPVLITGDCTDDGSRYFEFAPAESAA